MKNRLFILLLAMAMYINMNAQEATSYSPNSEFPFGKPNALAPKELQDFAHMIGISDCESQSLRPDGSWADPVNMTWTFKYIMDGMAVQDETIKEDGRHSGSIRQFSADSTKWYVHYYSTSRISTTSRYQGTKEGADIVLYKSVSDITTADNKKLFFRLTFSDISPKGFQWRGEWVEPDKTGDKEYGVTWKIGCTKRQ